MYGRKEFNSIIKKTQRSLNSFQIDAEDCNPFVEVWVGKTENGNLIEALTSGCYT